jgi:mannose-6-phosphate isomerase-like protein (cupin superfamily)
VRGIHFVEPEGYDLPARDVPGAVASPGVTSRLVSPPGFPLWLLRRRLPVGAHLTWSGDGGDEAVYVVRGALDVDGRVCPAGGCVVVEAGATPTVTASADAELVHVGHRAPDGDDSGSGATHGVAGTADHASAVVHVVGPGGTFARVEPGRTSRYYADSTCPGCDITVLLTGRDEPYVSAAHSHSSDELIHVLEGELVVGRTVLGPGSTVAVAAGRRYGFRSDGFRFLNYRPGPSEMTTRRDAPPRQEGGAVNGFEEVMDLR